MADRIFKYEFAIEDLVDIPMPRGAVVLTVQLQRGVPCLWARVDPANPRERRRFRIFGTGHELPNEPGGGRWHGRYVGTFQMAGGDLVWHLYEDRTE
jgi:hypothetical protein